MKLVYTKAPHVEVKVGDVVKTGHRNEVTVMHFEKPHKPSSSGKVTVRHGKTGPTQEFYVGVIGAEWIEREDQVSQPAFSFYARESDGSGYFIHNGELWGGPMGNDGTFYASEACPVADYDEPLKPEDLTEITSKLARA